MSELIDRASNEGEATLLAKCAAVVLPLIEANANASTRDDKCHIAGILTGESSRCNDT